MVTRGETNFKIQKEDDEMVETEET